MSDLLKQLAEQSTSIVEYAKKKYPDRVYMFDFTKKYWQAIYDARENGTPIVMCSANFPVELVYALDATPLVLDTVPVRLASGKDTFKYIDLAEKYLPSTVCGINKVGLGSVFSGDFGVKPDALMYCSLPCDSSRSMYPAVSQFLDVPSFCIDTPYRKDEAGFKYVGENVKEAYEFLQKALGRKHDMNKMAEVIERSNKAAKLLTDISYLRRAKPCPLPSRMLVMNELQGSTMGSQYLVDYLQEQYDIGKANVDKKQGVTPGEEKYRVLWLQNMVWSSVGVMDWMENEFNAVAVMDAFGYQTANIIDDPYDEDQLYTGLAIRSLGSPMVHGASGPAEKYFELTEQCMQVYGINMGLFAGHIGCKHTWAVSKIVKDIVEQKYGVPTLTFDLDSVDIRYKPVDEVKALIREFIETIEAGEAKK